jgi:hypothetical protein
MLVLGGPTVLGRRDEFWRFPVFLGERHNQRRRPSCPVVCCRLMMGMLPRFFRRTDGLLMLRERIDPALDYHSYPGTEIERYLVAVSCASS